ncbi:MAG: SAP domain-containing protein [Nitrospirae bacterium]|nr:SAP domain-containing protein [Nitrospirota bacterium]
MTLKDVKEMAKQFDIKVGKMKKDEIIRSIQRAEGNFDCFGTAIAGDCNQNECAWRADCLNC